MLLAIDVGNTNSVFSVAKNKKIVSEWRCSTDGNIVVSNTVVSMGRDEYGPLRALVDEWIVHKGV